MLDQGYGIVVRDEVASSIISKIQLVEGDKYFLNKSFMGLIGGRGLFTDCAGGVLTTTWSGYKTASDSEYCIKNK